MPPLNDDLANAQLIVVPIDGTPIVVAGSTIGATAEAAETADGYDQPSVWFKFQITDPVVWARLDFAADTPGYNVYAELYTGSASPADYDALTYANTYWGDGTDDPPADTVFASPIRGQWYYLYVGNWDWDGSTGDFHFSLTIDFTKDPTYEYDASLDAGSHPALSVVGGRIRDQQQHTASYPAVDRGPTDMQDSFYLRASRLPRPGRYTVKLGVHPYGAGSNQLNVGMVHKQIGPNGLAMMAKTNAVVSGDGDVLVTLDGSSYFGNPSPGSANWDFGERPDYLPVAAGDEIAFRIFDATSGGGGVDVGTLKLTWVDDTARSTPSLLAGSYLGLGMTSDVDPSLTSDPDASVQTLAVAELNGDVYLLWSEYGPTGESILLKKWDGTSWTLVSNDVWGHGYRSTSRHIGSLAICSDGDSYLYLGWAETTSETTTPTSPIAGQDGFGGANWHWRCKRYDPSGGGSFIELGTGQRRYNPSTQPAEVGSAFNSGTGGHGMRMLADPGSGRVWLAMAERDTSRTNYADNKTRPCVWYWDGSAWRGVHPPGPSNLHSATNYYIDPVYADRERHCDITLCHHDGPSAWPSCIYFAVLDDGPNAGHDYIEYWEYDGSTWSNEIAVFPTDISGYSDGDFNDPGLPASTYGRHHRGMGLLNDGERPILFAALVTAIFDLTITAKLNAGGTGWDRYGSGAMDSIGGYSGPPNIDMQLLAGSLIASAASYTLGGYQVTKQTEWGSGDGWHLATGGKDSILCYQGVSETRITVSADGGKLYVAASDGFVLGVWKFAPPGGIVSFSAVKIPPGPHMTVR